MKPTVENVDLLAEVMCNAYDNDDSAWTDTVARFPRVAEMWRRAAIAVVEQYEILGPKS